MNKLIAISFIIFTTLLALASSASAKTYTLSFLKDGSASQTAPYKAEITVSNFWKFVRYDDSKRTGITLARRVSKKCTVVVGARTRTGSDYKNANPEPFAYPVDDLALASIDEADLSGPLTNRASDAGGVPLLTSGGWGFMATRDTSGKPAYTAAGGYSASERDSNDEYLLLGVRTQLTANLFSKCSAKQVTKFRSSLPFMVKTIQLK